MRAYAKINIGLRILNKRNDGYHNIETIFHRINLYDEISFINSNNISLECNHPEVPTNSRNLCLIAAQIIKERYNNRKGVRIILQKSIPIGAGLGGGSSDAACILKHLPGYWGLEIPKQELNDIASKIGSDIPYFLENGTAYATGRGEKLEYFQLDIPYWIILVQPNIHISTAWAYNNLKLKKNQHENNLKDLVISSINHPEKLRKLVTNDFEDLVFNNHPDLLLVKEKLYKSGAEFVQMSGSGSSIFAFFQSEKDAIDSIKIFEPPYKVFLTEPNFYPTI